MARSTSSSQSWNTLLVMACAAIVIVGTAVMAADPDPLQDFCVADLSANAPLVNGLPCIPRANVTAEDFVYRGF
jgi:hypothetical protein